LAASLDGIVEKIKESLEKENYRELIGLLTQFTSIRVLDPACGSGSFLIIDRSIEGRVDGKLTPLFQKTKILTAKYN